MVIDQHLDKLGNNLIKGILIYRLFTCKWRRLHKYQREVCTMLVWCRFEKKRRRITDFLGGRNEFSVKF